jgi:multiple sugar transport system permease protein
MSENVTTKKKTKKSKGFESYNRYGYYFIAPFFIIFLLFQLYPIIYTFMISFSNMSGFTSYADSAKVGLANYINLFHNSIFIDSIKNTLELWVINIIPQMGMALLLASWWTNTKLKIKGQRFWKTVFYMPNMIMAATVAGLFLNLFSYPDGPANVFIKQVLHLPAYNFFQEFWGTRLLIAFIQFWMWYGQTAIVLVAGILSIDESLFEAARMDGASDGAIFRKITIPLLKPILMYTFITSFIGGLQVFDIPYFFSQGGPQGSNRTLGIYIYQQAFSGAQPQYGIAAAASVILLILSGIVSIFFFRAFRERANKALAGK